MVRDVRPFEEMKLRLLNGAHSSIAYLGLLAGHETVAKSFGDPAIRRFVQALWAEAAPTLPKDAGLDPKGYIAALTERFDNTALAHRNAQIANDGSQKLPQRIVGSALDRLAAGAGADHLMLTVAAWIHAAELRGTTLPARPFHRSARRETLRGLRRGGEFRRPIRLPPFSNWPASREASHTARRWKSSHPLISTICARAASRPRLPLFLQQENPLETDLALVRTERSRPSVACPSGRCDRRGDGAASSQ